MRLGHLLQVADRLQPVLARRRLQHGDPVTVLERRLLEQRLPAFSVELLGEGVGAGRRLRQRLLAEGDAEHDPRVLGIEGDLAAAERLVDQLRRADVLLVLHLEALGLERLLVQLAEDVLLGKVLRPDDDRSGLLLLERGRRRGGSPEHDGDTEGDREGRLGGPAIVLSDHVPPPSVVVHPVETTGRTSGSNAGSWCFSPCGVSARCTQAERGVGGEREQGDADRGGNHALGAVRGLVDEDVAEAAAARDRGDRRGGHDEDGGRPDAREQERQRERQLDAPSHLPRRHPHPARGLDRIRVDLVDRHIGIREDRRDRQDRRARPSRS